MAPERSNDAAAGDEGLMTFGIGDEVEIALAVAGFDIFEPVILLGHAQQDLRQEVQMVDVNAELAGLGAEDVAFDADDVAEIEVLIQLVFALGHDVLADVDLHAFASLLEVHESGFAHAADRDDPSRDFHRRFAFIQLFRSGLGILRPEGRNRVREVKPLAVGTESHRLDRLHALQSLLEQVIFERQIKSPCDRYYNSSLDSISIVIPAYNEEKRLPPTLDRVAQYLCSRPWHFRELLVVDDGSRDGTVNVVEQFSSRFSDVRVLRNPGNRGKGYSVRHGMLEAKGEWVLFSDADLSTPIEELDKLYEWAQRNSAVIAIGSRAMDRSLVTVRQPMMRDYSGRFFNMVMRMATGMRFKDTQCGFKMFRQDAAKAVFKRQQLDGFGFDVEAIYIAQQLGLKTVEVPVRWQDVAGTKVSLLNGLNGFADLVRVRANEVKGLYR